MIRVELWVGLQEHQMDWIGREGQGGSFKIYAETVRNRISIMCDRVHTLNPGSLNST